jgi:3-methyl-2-oxobutanoate hydroxymethyltransferase
VAETGRERVHATTLAGWKRAGRKIVMLTAYDYPTARLADEAGIDLLLVGDTLGMVVLGYESTVAVTLDDILHHARAVVRGAGSAHVVADLPFMTYEVADEQAVANAGRLIKEGGAHAVKLEGGERMAARIRAITAAGIPVMGHVGLTPQTAEALGGFKVQGRTAEAAGAILKDALAVEAAGAYAVVLEAVPGPLARLITARLTIPTIGIGAGPDCDGQVLVTPDLLGLDDRLRPRFVKRYVDLGEQVRAAMAAYAADVRAARFPGPEHTYGMTAAEADRLLRFDQRDAEAGSGRDG